MIRTFKYLSFLNVGCSITKNNRGIKVYVNVCELFFSCNITKNNRGIKVSLLSDFAESSCSITRNNRGIKGTIKDSRGVKRSEEK